MKWQATIGKSIGTLGVFIILLYIVIIIIRCIKIYREMQRLKKRNTPYINQPLNNKDDDQIGVSVYVEKIKSAISAGAEIIAIASDFGTGKSSIISLLEKEYGFWAKLRFKFSTINLWGFVKADDKAIEIHRNFIYQLVSHLNIKRGSYLSKRMSKNYGVLRLGLGSSLMMFYSFISLTCLFLAEIIRRYSLETTEFMQKFKSNITESHMLNLSIIFYLFFLILLFYIITRTDIVFSLPKSDSSREIDENIIMDYYRMQVLNRGLFKHYVVIVEDLDRISNPQVIFDFLIELHKYYIPEYDNRIFRGLKNKVTFIVCIKPAAQLQSELNEWKEKNSVEIKEFQMQEVYSKIFDLIIELKKINIDNYDAILRGLLEEKKSYLCEKDLIYGLESDVFNIEGIQWIIRGEELSIREIKQRLNDALILYEVLVDKFGSKDIEFQKCIIVSYLNNAFSEDMLMIKDNTFEECINSYIKGERDYTSILSECSASFIEAIEQLIEGKQIQADYRVYFYNYPKKSYLYDIFELKVINALLYNVIPEKDFEIALEKTGEERILYAIKKIHDLKIKLPRVALKYEKILSVVIKSYPLMIVEYIREVLDYSEDEIKRTTSEIKDILQILLSNKDIKENIMNNIVSIWNNGISKKSMLEIRNMLCKEYKDNILCFSELFEQENPLITINEARLLADNIGVLTTLINYKASAFDDLYFEKMYEILSTKDLQSEEIQGFYINAYEVVTKSLVIKKLLQGLEKEDRIPFAVDGLLACSVSEGVLSKQEYIDLIETKEIMSHSVDNIHILEWSGGLSIQLCNELLMKGYFLDYIINVAVDSACKINLLDEYIKSIINSNAEDIFIRNEKSFVNLREQILRKKLEKEYDLLFIKPYPGIGKKELYAINDVDREIALMEKNEPVVDIEIIIKNFNSKYHGPIKTFKILQFICGICDTSQELSEAIYNLNMDNIRFRAMSKSSKGIIISHIKSKGMLKTTTEKIEFMKFIRCLLQELEKDIISDVVAAKVYEDEYVEVINMVDKISTQTIKNIKSLNYLHIYNDNVNSILLKEKLYTKYLYSITMKNMHFTIPNSPELIVAADNIFKANKLERMIGLMCKNEEYMRLLKEKEIYKNAPVTRERFVVLSQDSNMIKDIFSECKDEEIISYMSKVKGFNDYDAAKTFVDLVENRRKILVSEKVYGHTHHMLVDPYLKGRYTKIRNAVIKG